MKELKAEIFAVGKWNGIDVTQEMLIELANNFSRLADFIDVPLKLGHNEEQQMTDGEPALGWVDKVWVEGEKLFAKFVDLPDIVFDAIEKKRYKNVSIEALFDVNHKGVDYGTVLTAVALLGTDMPAVNTLSDLQTYMTANNLAFSSHATFSKKPSDKSEKSTMTPEEKAEFDRLKAENEAKDKLIAGHATEKAKFTTESAEKDAKIKELEGEKETSKFAAEKKEVEEDLEGLVKDKKITPAQRDKLLKDCDEKTIDSVKFTISTLKENKPMGKQDEQAKDDKSDEEDNSEQSPDEKVRRKARKYANENKVSFSVAVKEVLGDDPKLAREYADYNDKEVA